jgi:16S rRNA (uracil1498-N3)-methyltransferase
MRSIRIFCDSSLRSNERVILPAAAGHHLIRVLRLREGATLLVFDGAGSEFHADIVQIAGDQVTVMLGLQLPPPAPSPLKITLVQGISRGDRMDWTLQKATELGVHVIAPVLTSRSVVRLDDKQAEKKRAHWHGIVVGACEQCGRSQLPIITTPMTLRDYLTGVHQDGVRLVLSPVAPDSLAALSALPSNIELLIGPEGGLDAAEVAAARNADFRPVRLGPRVLRTETAALVALAVLQAVGGDLR